MSPTAARRVVSRMPRWESCVLFGVEGDIGILDIADFIVGELVAPYIDTLCGHDIVYARGGVIPLHVFRSDIIVSFVRFVRR